MKLHRVLCVSLLLGLGCGAVLLACVGDTPIDRPDAGGDKDVAQPDVTADVQNPVDGGADASCTAPAVNCNGVCVDLTKDGTNCGKCGRSCFGGTCTAGRCAAVTVVGGLVNPYILRSSKTPDVLVVASDEPLKDGGTNGGGVYRVAKPTGPATRMWTSTATTVNGASGLAVVGTNAFFLSRNSSNTVSGALVDLSNNPGSTPSSIAINANSLFQGVSAIDTGSSVFYAAGQNYGTNVKDGTNTSVQITGVGGTELAFAPADPYLIISDVFSGEIERCPRAATSCTPTVLYKNPDGQSTAEHFQIVGKILYWADNTSSGPALIRACNITAPCPSPLVIAKGEGKIGGLAVDATGAYWTDPVGGRIRSCANLTAGCDTNSETVVDGQVNATGITLDANAVYWTIRSASGSIRRTGR